MRFAILLRISSRRARIAIVLASSLASLGALEAGLRDHDDEIVFLEAGRRYGIRGGSHGTNSLGFHERELAMVPDEGTRRIVVLGDSMTWGTTTPDAAWPRIAETTLGTPWQLVNLSMYGYDAEQSLATLESVGWRYHPERVVFASYMNDLVPTELITVGDPALSAWISPRGFLPWSIRQNFATARIVEGSIRRFSYAESDTSDTFRDALIGLRAATLAHGVPLLVVGLGPHAMALGKACDEAAGEVGRCAWAQSRLDRQATIAAEVGVRFAPMLSALDAPPPEGWFPANRNDWEHPSEAGHRRIGYAVGSVLQGWVSQGLPAPP